MNSELDQKIGRSLCVTAQIIRNWAEKLLSPFDLTGEQLHLLESVSIERGIPQRTLCELVMKTPANLTRILDRMEKKGLVVRKDNPEDRRSSLVYRTEVGDKLIEEASGVLVPLGERIENGIAKENLEVFKQVICQINQNLFILPSGSGESHDKKQ